MRFSVTVASSAILVGALALAGCGQKRPANTAEAQRQHQQEMAQIQSEADQKVAQAQREANEEVAAIRRQAQEDIQNIRRQYEQSMEASRASGGGYGEQASESGSRASGGEAMTKEDYKDNVEKQANGYKDMISHYKSRLSALSGNEKNKVKAELDRADADLKKLNSQLDKLGDASDTNWQTMRTTIDKQLDALKTRLDKIDKSF